MGQTTSNQEKLESMIEIFKIINERIQKDEKLNLELVKTINETKNFGIEKITDEMDILVRTLENGKYRATDPLTLQIIRLGFEQRDLTKNLERKTKEQEEMSQEFERLLQEKEDEITRLKTDFETVKKSIKQEKRVRGSVREEDTVVKELKQDLKEMEQKYQDTKKQLKLMKVKQTFENTKKLEQRIVELEQENRKERLDYELELRENERMVENEKMNLEGFKACHYHDVQEFERVTKELEEETKEKEMFKKKCEEFERKANQFPSVSLPSFDALTSYLSEKSFPTGQLLSAAYTESVEKIGNLIKQVEYKNGKIHELEKNLKIHVSRLAETVKIEESLKELCEDLGNNRYQMNKMEEYHQRRMIEMKQEESELKKSLFEALEHFRKGAEPVKEAELPEESGSEDSWSTVSGGSENSIALD